MKKELDYLYKLLSPKQYLEVEKVIFLLLKKAYKTKVYKTKESDLPPIHRDASIYNNKTRRLNR